MSNNAPDVSLTRASVKEYARRAFIGEVGDIRDAACPGLMLRMRAKKVNWSYRGKLGALHKRWNLGGAEVDPETGRHRCNAVKAALHAGKDPSRQVTEWITGISIAHQQNTRDEASIKWEKARDDFLGFVFGARRGATYDDYRKFLCNTPELSRFKERYVSTITDVDVVRLLDIGKRAESYAEHLQRVLSSMWTYLADA
jgi:hypothetical protein